MNNDFVCKICLEEIDIEKSSFIIPCNCKNPVHEDCLIEWINKRPKGFKNRKVSVCEICKGSYNAENVHLKNVITSIENENSERVYKSNLSKFICVLLFILFLGVIIFCLNPFILCLYCNNYNNIYSQNITDQNITGQNITL